jgi:intracellular sulfur oxidation DsrE/DsrF family protein
MNPSPDLSGAVLVVSREGMGSGPPELQRRLLSTYLGLLLENRWTPLAVCFYTDGVKLLTEGSPVLEPLRALEAAGVRLIACKTCLDYFEIGDKLRVGIVGGMGDILAATALAAKVIAL